MQFSTLYILLFYQPLYLPSVSISWGSSVLWQYSCGSCLRPSAHIVSFALEAQYGRSSPCFNGRLLAGLFSSQEMQAAVWRAGKCASEGGGMGKKSPLSPSSVTHIVCVCVYSCEQACFRQIELWKQSWTARPARPIRCKHGIFVYRGVYKIASC